MFFLSIFQHGLGVELVRLLTETTQPPTINNVFCECDSKDDVVSKKGDFHAMEFCKKPSYEKKSWEKHSYESIAFSFMKAVFCKIVFHVGTFVHMRPLSKYKPK